MAFDYGSRGVRWGRLSQRRFHQIKGAVLRGREVIRNLMAVLLMAFVASTFGVLGYWTADRDLPTTVLASSIDNLVVPAGGTLKINRHLIRHRNCATHVDRQVIDSTGVRFSLPPTDYLVVGPTGEQSFIQPVEVPDAASPGPATFFSTASYICNPVQALWPIAMGTIATDFTIR
jgi:hypothetical protein